MPRRDEITTKAIQAALQKSRRNWIGARLAADPGCKNPVRGWQAKVARDVKVDATFIGYLLDGTRGGSGNTLRAVAEALGIDVGGAGAPRAGQPASTGTPAVHPDDQAALETFLGSGIARPVHDDEILELKRKAAGHPRRGSISAGLFVRWLEAERAEAGDGESAVHLTSRAALDDATGG